ncbi:GIY-YIG nuclease family protein [Corynebacterium sp. A21]|uniref:GIY-YIG nuclease family protein n=1 Tax=Corynebacterium sp. A21 TaxID=3457318 RepID=UPI003FD5FCEC
MSPKQPRTASSSNNRIKLTGRIYDVRELDSVAIILVGEPSLRGLYRLGFADGGAYVGQSINVVSRFTSHRKRWEDIVTFEFFPIPVDDLNSPERTLITETEAAAPVRNIRDTKRPHGEADHEFTSTEGVSTFLPWDRDKRVRPGENISGKKAQKFNEIARLNEYEVLRDLVGWFIYETLPDPYNTQRHLWIASCLPSTNHSKSHQRLLALSAGNLEIFVVYQNIIDGTAVTDLFINTSTVDMDLSSLQDPEGQWLVEHGSYSHSAVTTWRFTMESFEDILNGTLPFPHLKLLLENAYQLNVRLMRQGGTMFGRFHNELLARDLLAASLKWDNDE